MQHEVTLSIHRLDQYQQAATIISGNHGVVGMFTVQRQRLLVRDVECSAAKTSRPECRLGRSLCYCPAYHQKDGAKN